MKGKKFKNNNLLYSFKYAFIGIYTSLKSERNMFIHFSIMVLVIICGIIFKISFAEWITCIILFGLVISAELINTSIETTIDLCMPDIHPKAKLAKDTAAGAVLVLALVSAIIGLMIFIPKLF